MFQECCSVRTDPQQRAHLNVFLALVAAGPFAWVYAFGRNFRFAQQELSFIRRYVARYQGRVVNWADFARERSGLNFFGKTASFCACSRYIYLLYMYLSLSLTDTHTHSNNSVCVDLYVSNLRSGIRRRQHLCLAANYTALSMATRRQNLCSYFIYLFAC